jgi:hypothetical protein
MSDSTSDAYCRVHGLSGKKANNCGLGALPIAAGPWVRPDGKPFAPAIDRLLAPTNATYYPASMNESGIEVAVSDRVYTGTDDTGVYTTGCTNWTTTAGNGAMGEVNGGGTSWTDLGTDPFCTSTGHLRCLEAASGPPLPSRHPVAKKAFLTSVSGTGNLSTWTDANGLTGIAAADAICQARARYAGYANSQNFKAWMSSGTAVTSRILTNGPWARPDGVVVGTSEADMNDGRLAAPLYLMENHSYAAGNSEIGNVWTGTSTFGSATFVYCSVWASTINTGTIGRHDLLDGRWSSATSIACSSVARLYCAED